MNDTSPAMRQWLLSRTLCAPMLHHCRPVELAQALLPPPLPRSMPAALYAEIEPGGANILAMRSIIWFRLNSAPA